MKQFLHFVLVFLLSNTAQAQLSIFADNYGTDISFSAFGGSTNDVTVDNTQAYSGTSALKIVVPAAGYTGGALIHTTPQNLSSYTALTFWVKGSAAKTLNVTGIGNNAVTNVYQSEYTNVSVTTTWTKVTIPIPNPAKLTAETGLFHFAEGSDEGTYTIWLDDIRYENIAVGTPTAAMATESVNLVVGQTFSPNGTTCTFNGVTFAIGKAYFNYTSSNTGVATINASGVGTTVAPGTSNITATLGSTAVAGTLTVNVSGGATEPTTAAPTPTRSAANVTSLFSNAYTDLAGTNWNPSWGQSTVYSEVMIAGNATKKYATLNYQGAEPAATVDLSSRTHLHFDAWAATAVNFRVKLVDFGANGIYGGGDDTEHELSYTLTGGSWDSKDIPLSEFTGMTAKAHFAQFIISSTTSPSPTVWVDNIYFYNSTPIPVELVNFKVKAVQKTSVLTWQTASERNNQGFTIERSNDGIQFSPIGQVKGQGTTVATNDYTFTDETPSVGVNYYRLRQRDFDGKESFSPIVTLSFGKNNLIVKSTLVNDVLDIILSESTATPLSIFNVSGQQVYAAKVQGSQSIDVSTLAAGLYFVRTGTGEISRFVKQ